MKTADQAKGNQGRTLAVIVHGFGASSDQLNDLRELAKEQFPDCLLIDRMRSHAKKFSFRRASSIVNEVIQEIDKTWTAMHFDNIVFIGHSMGAVIARRVYVEAAGLPDEWSAPGAGEAKSCVEEPLSDVLEQAPAGRPWARHVRRIILLAGMSRGWSIDNAKDGVRRFFWLLTSGIAHLVPFSKPTIFDIRRGAPFIVQTRLRWLQLLLSEKHVPDVVQFLGSDDDLVAPNDTVDYADVAHDDAFRMVELAHTNHANIIDLTGRGHSETMHEAAAQRRLAIGRAMSGDFENLQLLTRRDLDDQLPPPPNADVKDVVFIIHGIRDKGYWTKRVGARVKQLARQTHKELVVRSPTYGYFPILPFLLPWYRRQKVEWFMDQYVETKAKYPRSRFHFMGHSNGTYLCARALQDYPAAAFGRIMFAGSVVRSEYDWAQHISGGRVHRLYNAVATRDLVVALFPNGLRWFSRFFDLGGAGHRGFALKHCPKGYCYQHRFVKGSHAAGKKETQWDQIADFLVTGTFPGSSDPDLAGDQPLWIKIVSHFSPWLVIAIALLLVASAVTLVGPLFGIDYSGRAGWLVAYANSGAAVQTMSLFTFGWLIRFLMLRF